MFLIEFGPALLEEHFARLTALSFENPLLSLPEMPELAPVMSVLEEMVSGVFKCVKDMSEGRRSNLIL